MKNVLEYWRARSNLKLSQAALLISENYQENWTDEELLSAPPLGFKPIYEELLEDAVNVENEYEEHEELEDREVTPIESCYFTRYTLKTDKPKDHKMLSDKDWLSVKVEKCELIRWLQVKSLKSRFFDGEDLNESESSDCGATEKSADKSLGDKERNSLYRIIGALLETLEKKDSFTKPLKNQSALINYLCKEYKEFEGISKSNLEKLIPKIKKLMDEA